MSKYFDLFPRTIYRINKNDNPLIFGLPVNILFRVRMLVQNLDRAFHYYEYTVKDGETPEILAEKVYGNPEAHWLILMTNDIIDPQFDWVMGYDVFNKYIIDKYGSIETAQTTYHHYEKILQSRDSYSDTTTNTVVQITYSEYANLAVSGTATTYTVGNYTVDLYSEYRNAVTNYDWEFEENEKRRQIKIIKRQYYLQIMEEFNSIVRNTSRLRSVI